MTSAEFESVYEAIAKAIDKVGSANAEVYLAKLALALAHELDDGASALKIIAECTSALTGVSSEG